MIVSKNQLGPKRGSGYVNSRAITSSNSSSTSSFVLENSSVKFVFKDDPLTGIFLYSFQNKENSRVFYNKSRSLWKLGIRRNVFTDSSRLTSYTEDIILYPRRKYFTDISPSDATSSPSSYTFTWSNYPYDHKVSGKTCKITITATLSGSHLDLTAKVTSTPGVPTSSLTSGSVLHAICLPEIVLDKDTTIWEEDVLVIASLMGDCTRNPIKNLDSPRFNSESINYKQYLPGGDATFKFLKGGQQGSPTINTRRINLGHPGWMSIPLFVFGNRQEKSGFLYYAMDPTGIHAKNFQAWSDGKAMHLRVWDISDHEVDPYGVGGKYRSGYAYNSTNQLGWSVRIRPFNSPTKWVDWYGPRLYKEEVVPEQEGYGWLPKSFYSRYSDNLLSAEEVEVPFYTSCNGHLSGTADDIHTSLSWYQDLYSGISNQNIRPRLFAHVQEVNLHSAPLRSQTAQYFGWVPWATGATGITNYKSPNYQLNTIFSGSVSGANYSGIVDMLYLPQLFQYSKYSDIYDLTLSLDTVAKDIARSDLEITEAMYYQWESDYISSISNTLGLKSCIGVGINYRQRTGVAGYLASKGAGVYHDTLGNWGSKGCFANEHVYLNEQGDIVTDTHPRGQFTHYFNQKQINLLSGMTAQLSGNSYSGLNGIAKHSMAQGSEFLCDTQLKYAPMSIPLAVASPVDVGVYFRDTETTRTDFLYEVDAGAFIQGLRRKDPYKLCVPTFQIALGDRCILGNWINPTLSNLMNLSGYVPQQESGNLSQSLNLSGYISYQEVTSYAPDQILSLRTPTHAERVQQLRHIVSNDFRNFNRLTVYHRSYDYRDYDISSGTASHNSNTAYVSGLTTEDHSSVFAEPAWTGYIEYAKQHMRVQAYEPDYVYHGTLQQPLEDYSSPSTSGAFVVFLTNSNNTSFSEPTGLEDESIVHYIKKHPIHNSFLMYLSNWSDSAQTFTGTFDPILYGLNLGYNIYSLDVSTSGLYGTKTLLDNRSARFSYSISATLAGASTTAYEFVQTTGIRPSFTGTYLYTDTTPIRYAYTNRTVSTNKASIVYGYESECNDTLSGRYYGYKAATTQSIVNNLPQWMNIRQDSNSQGWHLVNSWGMSLDAVVEDSVDIISNLFLETADKKQRYSVDYVDLTRIYTPNIDNILFNSSFTLKDVARNKLPAGWAGHKKGKAELTSSKSSIIGNVLALTSGSISQNIFVDRTIKDITGSVYILAENTDANVKLILSAEKIDGTVIYSQAEITTRSREWRRLTCTLGVMDEVYRLQLCVVSTGLSTVYICAPKLENNSSATAWSRSVTDIPHWINSISPGLNIVQMQLMDNSNTKIPLYPVGEQEEFLDMQIPTRAESLKNKNQNLSPAGDQEYGRRVTYFNEVYNTQWTKSVEYKIQEKSLSPTEFDLFGDYDIKEVRYNQEGEIGILAPCDAVIKVIGTTVRKGVLYSLCKEIDDSGTKHTIKLVYPKVPPKGETFLESLTDILIELPLNTIISLNQEEEIVSSIGFSDMDDTVLVVNTNFGRRFSYKLHFDYYYFDSRRNRVYTLENYQGYKLQIL